MRLLVASCCKKSTKALARTNESAGSFIPLDGTQTLPYFYLLCSSRKNPYPLHGRSLEIPRERKVSKAKFLEAMYENKLNFLGGGRCKIKNLPWAEYGYFLELHVMALSIRVPTIPPGICQVVSKRPSGGVEFVNFVNNKELINLVLL